MASITEYDSGENGPSTFTGKFVTDRGQGRIEEIEDVATAIGSTTFVFCNCGLRTEIMNIGSTKMRPRQWENEKPVNISD